MFRLLWEWLISRNDVRKKERLSDIQSSDILCSKQWIFNLPLLLSERTWLYLFRPPGTPNITLVKPLHLPLFQKKKKPRNCIQLRSSFFTPTHAQLTETSVKLASLLLQHLSDMMQSAHQKMRGRRIEGRFVLSEELIKAITRVTSDLIEASSLLILRYAGASEN